MRLLGGVKRFQVAGRLESYERTTLTRRILRRHWCVSQRRCPLYLALRALLLSVSSLCVCPCLVSFNLFSQKRHNPGHETDGHGRHGTDPDPDSTGHRKCTRRSTPVTERNGLPKQVTKCSVRRRHAGGMRVQERGCKSS